MKNFFKKLEHFFLVESTKIETFPQKTALSEASVKTDSVKTVENGRVTKNRVLQVTTLFF